MIRSRRNCVLVFGFRIDVVVAAGVRGAVEFPDRDEVKSEATGEVLGLQVQG